MRYHLTMMMPVDPCYCAGVRLLCSLCIIILGVTSTDDGKILHIIWLCVLLLLMLGQNTLWRVVLRILRLTRKSSSISVCVKTELILFGVTSRHWQILWGIICVSWTGAICRKLGRGWSTGLWIGIDRVLRRMRIRQSCHQPHIFYIVLLLVS